MRTIFKILLLLRSLQTSTQSPQFIHGFVIVIGYSLSYSQDMKDFLYHEKISLGALISPFCDRLLR